MVQAEFSTMDFSTKSDIQNEKSASNPLSRKISKILETRLENDKVCALFHKLRGRMTYELP